MSDPFKTEMRVVGTSRGALQFNGIQPVTVDLETPDKALSLTITTHSNGALPEYEVGAPLWMSISDQPPVDPAIEVAEDPSTDAPQGASEESQEDSNAAA